jgi:hypothetical protein
MNDDLAWLLGLINFDFDFEYGNFNLFINLVL